MPLETRSGLAYIVIPAFAAQVNDFALLDDTEKPEEVSSVVSVETEPEKGVSSVAAQIREAEKAPASSTVKVKVVSPFRVVHGGKPYVGGDVLDVPNDKAETWLKSKWVEPVSRKGKS